MHITVNRFVSDSETTISQISIDNKFQCFGLEDEYRATKLTGETRIPAGQYQITLRSVGGFHSRYAKRFGHIHQGMLHIQDVPGFTHILIHCGNKDDDTSGCLLVGTGAITEPNDMMITNSTGAYKQLYQHVIESAKQNNLTISFVDNDR